MEAIAEAVGFCNASYFIKVFRNVTSDTPAGYRKRAHLPAELIEKSPKIGVNPK